MLTGAGLTYTEDTDGDGMSDATEFNLAALGFDWQVSQPSLVSALYSNAASAGLYSAAQVQAINIGTPLIQRDASGNFKLTLSLKKSTDLVTYNPFAFVPGAVSVNESGELEFIFSTPDSAAFFRLESK